MRLFGAGIICLAAVVFPAALPADAGVLVPGGAEQPDPSRLALDDMQVDVRIEDGTARVRIQQIYVSRISRVQEGEWVFALPARAAISDFAVWDDITRIPGVILERRRADEIYERLKAQAIDPGLLRQGEYGVDEARRSSVFSAKVTPIPGYGYKRVEVEYHERLTVENLRSYFALPLRPEAYEAQRAGRLRLRFELLSSHAVEDFQVVGEAFALTIDEQSPNRVSGSLAAENVDFTEDFAVEWGLTAPAEPKLEVLTYRDPSPQRPHLTATAAPEPENPPGYLQASLLLPNRTAEAEGPPRSVVALFDVSLSMQWEKLEAQFQALETLLLGLRPQDRFNVLLYADDVQPFAASLQPASRDAAESALDFVRAGFIRGGTDLEAALGAALTQFRDAEGEPYLVLFGDGGATRGRIHNARLAEQYAALRSALPVASRPRTFVFGIGDEANLPLLEMLGREDGVFERVRSTEPIEFKLNAFLSKIGREPVDGLSLAVEPGGAVDMVYPLETSWFAGSLAQWVGRYPQPAQASLRAAGGGVDAASSIALPAEDLNHPQVGRLWARARVDALLEKIERDGEDEDTIDEIIYWSKKFKFVTPYTSFLAAPRSLLRPRVIRPGDPILRIKTDPSIVSVTALFPFGLVKPLKYLGSEDTWQTRFLAPKDTPDGKHEVRLVLRDQQGRAYRETKSFLILSQAPVVEARLDKTTFRRGERVELKVAASRTTRTLSARMYGVPPVALRWNADVKLNTGSFVIPPDLPPGEYKLQLTAEDFAHNIGVKEVALAIIP